MTRRRHPERGAELIEVALITPVLMLILLGIAEFGLMFQAYEVVTNAAREGARVGMLVCSSDSSCYADEDVIDRVDAYVAAGLPAGAATPVTNVACVTLTPGGVSEQVTVSYTYTFQFIGPIASFLGASFTSVPITAEATMRKEKQGCPG